MKIYIKNTDTNKIIIIEAESYGSVSKNFRTTPYEQVSDSEKNDFLLQEAKDKKIEEVRSYTKSLIASKYSETDQLNILGSGDELAIAERHAFIDPILTKSRSIRSKIMNKDCDTLEKLNAINTDF